MDLAFQLDWTGLVQTSNCIRHVLKKESCMCFHIVFRIVNNYVSWTVCVLIRIYKPLCLEMSFVIEYYGCADKLAALFEESRLRPHSLRANKAKPEKSYSDVREIELEVNRMTSGDDIVRTLEMNFEK